MVHQYRGPVPLLISKSCLSTEANKTGAWRFLKPRYDEKTSPCSMACPAGEDIGRIEMLTAQGLFKEAWETVLFENPFPGVCGRICHRPCEAVCNRGHFDEPVSIHTVERFLAHTASRYELKPHLERLPSRKQRIAVGGAGPSGLAAAYFLARLGYGCDVYEAMPEPGGLLRWGLPAYRLPVDALKNEIERIEELGVHIFCGKPFGEEFIAQSAGSYDAVFLGCGLGRSMALTIPGEDLDGIEDGIGLLRKIAAGEAPALSGPVAVIGGGYVAIDTARCVVRLGGKALLLYVRQGRDTAALKEEIAMAVEEGVEILHDKVPVRIDADGDQYLIELHETRAEGRDAGLDYPAGTDKRETETVRVSRIFKAAGFEAERSWMNPPRNGRQAARLNNTVLVMAGGRLPVVFGGDLANATKSVAHAVASGKEAAIALDVLFNEGADAVRPELDRCKAGRSLSMEIHMGGQRSKRSRAVVLYNEINTDYFRFSSSITKPRLLKRERMKSFAEIDLNISAGLAMREAERCFNCGLCNQCDNCRLFCPDLAVSRDLTALGRSIDYNYCKGCGICVVECPRNAMSLEEEESHP